MTTKFVNAQSFGYGSYDKLPHYAVIGKPTEFYIWIVLNKNAIHLKCCSEWFKGKEAMVAYHQLKAMHGKDRKLFTNMMDELMTQHPKLHW